MSTNNFNKPNTYTAKTATVTTTTPNFGNALHSATGTSAGTWWKAWRMPIALGLGAAVAYNWWYQSQSRRHRESNTRYALENGVDNINSSARQLGRDIDHAVKRTGDAIQRDVKQVVNK